MSTIFDCSSFVKSFQNKLMITPKPGSVSSSVEDIASLITFLMSRPSSLKLCRTLSLILIFILSPLILLTLVI